MKLLDDFKIVYIQNFKVYAIKRKAYKRDLVTPWKKKKVEIFVDWKGNPSEDYYRTPDLVQCQFTLNRIKKRNLI